MWFVYFEFVKFKFTSLNHKIRRCFWGPGGSKKIAKDAQNDPTQAKSADQNLHQNATFGKQRSRPSQSPHGLTVVDTTGHGGCHGRPMVATMAVVEVFSPSCVGFSRPFVFPRDVSTFSAVFHLKRGSIWTYYTPSTLHSSTILIHLVLDLV